MIEPKFVAVLHRKLKSNSTYEDFYKAWLPPGLDGKDPTKEPVEYFKGPVQVINAVNAKDPTDIISIGIIWTSSSGLEEDIKRTEQTENMRAEKILKVADRGQENKFYIVKDVNLLGTDLPQ